jgi:hypothetical protein
MARLQAAKVKKAIFMFKCFISVECTLRPQFTEPGCKCHKIIYRAAYVPVEACIMFYADAELFQKAMPIDCFREKPMLLQAPVKGLHLQS